MATAGFSPSLSASGGAEHQLQTRLQQLTRRRNAQKMMRSLVGAAIPGVLVATASVALYKLHIIPDGPLWAPAAMIGVSLLWGARRGWMEKRGDFVAARDADDSLGLNDRLSSAFSFVSPEQVRHTLSRPKPRNVRERIVWMFNPPVAYSTAHAAASTNLVPALVGDAAARAGTLDPKQVYPLRFDRRAQVLTVASLAFVGLCFAPDYPLFLSSTERIERKALAKEGEKLVAVSKEIRKTETPKAEDVTRLNRKLEALGKKMVRGRLTKRAALTDIGELKKELKKAQQKPNNQGQNSAGMAQIPEAMKEAPLQSKTGRDAQKDLQNNKFEDAAKRLEQLADKLERNELTKEEKKQAAADLEKVAQQLKQRGGEANKQAAQKMEDAAKQLREEDSKQGQNQQGQQQQGQKSGQQQQSGQQEKDGKKEDGQQQQGQQGQQQQQQKGGGQQPSQQGQQQQQQGGQKDGQQQQSGQGKQQQSPGEGQEQQSSGAQQGPKQGGQQGASEALRDMAQGLRQGSGSQSNSQNLQEMMGKLRDAETGTNGGSQAGKPPTNAKLGDPSECKGGDCETKMAKLGKDLRATSGKGINGGGAGLGPRDQSQGSKSGGGVSNLKMKRTGDLRRYADKWSDTLPATRKKLDKVTGKWGDSGEVDQLPTRGEGKGSQVKTPYYEVYEAAKRDAEDAVARESVPPAYKESVKDYFESLKP